MSAEVNKKDCNGCGTCVDLCPVAAIEIKNSKAIISNDCIECGVCVGECPNGAISLQKR